MTCDGGARTARAPRPSDVDTLIVGAGQAGLALSHHLTAAGHEHVVLERGRVGQRWHERWDSLTLLSPNWMNRLPGEPGPSEPGPADRDGFLPRAAFAAHLESYARALAAPVVEGVGVERIERLGRGFRISTTSGAWLARSVVLATGDAADPHVPLAPPTRPLSLHSSDYRRPELLPDGPVLVVGAGTSGQQLGLELRQAGRDVVLAAGRHSRAPRRYRGRDIFEWAHILGDFDRTIDEMPDVEAAKRVPLFPLSGANGGEDLGLDRLAAAGVAVTGRLTGFDGRRAVFADDLAANVAAADARLRKLLRRIDAHPPGDGWEPEPLPDVILPAGPRRSTCAGSGRSSGRPASGEGIRGSTSPACSTSAARSCSGAARHASRASTRSGSPISTGATPTSSAASAATPRSLRARSSSVGPSERAGAPVRAAAVSAASTPSPTTQTDPS